MVNKIKLKTQYVGISALNRFAGHLSASRITMLDNQLQQKIAIHKPDINLNLTSIEQQLADSTFGERVPADAEVIDVHHLGDKHVYRTCIIYRELDTLKLGHMEIRSYHTLHNRLGFMHNNTQKLRSLRKGVHIIKDELLTDTPGVVDGIYSFGNNFNVCLASIAGTAEDEFIFSDDILDKVSYDTIEKITFCVQSQQVMLYLYGDDVPRLIPEPGDKINKDNIIGALRTIDPSICVAQMSHDNMRKIDYILDERLEVQDGYIGETCDISVIRDVDKKEYITNTLTQLDEIADRQIEYYTRILATYRKEVASRYFGIDYRRGVTRDVECSDQTTAFMVRLSMLVEKRTQPKNKIKLLYKGEEIAPYTVNIHIHKTRIANLGSKFSDLSASKGVACSIWPAANMPVNEHGVRADVIAAQTASLGRNIVGRLFAQYFDQMADNAARYVCKQYGVEFKAKRRRILAIISKSVKTNDATFQHVYSYVLGMYKLACPDQYERIRSNTDATDIINWLVDIVRLGGATLTQNIDNLNGNAKQMVQAIENTIYAPAITPITYVDTAGKHITTKNAIRIAPIYMFPLERDGSESSATDTLKLQSQLFTSTVSKSDKWRAPMSTSNVALLGIDESIIISSAIHPRGMAEFVDRINSPKTHAAMVKAILLSDTPTGEHTLVDRTIHPFGTTSANRTITHVLSAYGSQLYYKDDEAE